MIEQIDNLIAKPPMKGTEYKIGEFTARVPTVDWVELRNQILKYQIEEIKKELLKDWELKGIAFRIFGSNDGVKPRFPKNGEAIQSAMEETRNTQLQKILKKMKEK